MTDNDPIALNSRTHAQSGISRSSNRLFFVTKNKDVDSIVVRLAGDSGDGIQLMGTQFAVSTALTGADFATFPDYPAEIRAPVGTTFGVSAYQINLGGGSITTPGDTPDVLVAFNPAALKVSLPLLHKGALVIVNNDAFTPRNLTKAGYDVDPRVSGALNDYQVVAADISHLNLEAVKEFGLSKSEGSRCKNFWALGLLLWMFDREFDSVEAWINRRLAEEPTLRDANIKALHAGHAFGETAELTASLSQIHVPAAQLEAGEYRGITGAEALALGIAAAGELADRSVLLCSYPITPASPLLHQLSRLGELGVGTFQAEDEIAAICAAIGASYGGMIGVTSSSGPGIALKTEAMGLAVSAELPLVIVNWQRGGPSTGLPTKTEQSDLYQAVYGRNADTPIPVICASTSGECFEMAIEAVRIALRHMTPVILLADGYLSNAAEPWRIPDMSAVAPIEANAVPESDEDPQRRAFSRSQKSLGRPWVTPGMPGLMHRVGGLEKDIESGHISYDPANHQSMTDLRAAKVRSVADFIPAQELESGPDSGDLVVVGWGSTYGPIFQAASTTGTSFVHLRYLNPLPKNLGELLGRFDNILVPEMNTGQLSTLLRDKLGVDPVSFAKVTGQPFLISELVEKIESLKGKTS
ncbi:MAG: 2-oxoacid:acceptor oxidoreductase subunit alpha [Gammaproteobacteria bacterium]|nr:2-oxoacid:acceptor oxidoreductase subunit alpha [Gammaproteobacteria bacterium]NNL52271.1 2-oxoacid:acceptor oxidoreductase subunit alpha [Woeseiaceae bacterium]